MKIFEFPKDKALFAECFKTVRESHKEQPIEVILELSDRLYSYLYADQTLKFENPYRWCEMSERLTLVDELRNEFFADCPF